jgi:hypothetical protein
LGWSLASQSIWQTRNLGFGFSLSSIEGILLIADKRNAASSQLSRWFWAPALY